MTRSIFRLNIIRCSFILVILLALQACSMESIASPTPIEQNRVQLITITPSIPTPEPSITIFPTSTPTITIPILTVDGPRTLEFEGKNKILFSLNSNFPDPVYNNYVINSDGTNIECITCDAYVILPVPKYSPWFSTPTWSPNGSMYAYNVMTDKVEGIVLRSKDNDRVIISGFNRWFKNFAWSPDGQYLAYETQLNNSGETICYLDVSASINSENCLQIDKMAMKPTWAPDSNRILFVQTNPKDYSLAIWDLNKQEVSPYTDLTANYALTPKWSPDGSKIGYILQQSEKTGYQSDLYVMNADGGERKLIPNTRGAEDFAWAPDGTKIVFTQLSAIRNDCGEGGACQPFTTLKTLDLETGSIKTLTDGKEWVGNPSWRP